MIRNMSITDISPEQIRKLTSIVTERVVIDIMTRTGLLSSILASVKCPDLLLWRMELNVEETQAHRHEEPGGGSGDGACYSGY